MIRFPPNYPIRPINLLQQHQSHQLMWKGQLGKGPGVVAAVLDGLAEAEGAADDEGDMAFAVGA